MQILLFEEQAHQALGHYPVWVAQLTRVLAADGHEVHVLTRHGWLYGPSVDHATGTYRMTRRHRAMHLIGTEVRRQSWLRLGKDRGRLPAHLGDSLRQVALVAAVRHRLRRLPGGVDTVVLVLSKASPVEFTLFAPSRASWALYAHDPPARVGGASNIRRVVRIAGRRARRLRLKGGYVRLITNSNPVGEAWREQVPWIASETIASASRPRADPAPRIESRATLGLPTEGTIALFFGVFHGGKDVDTLLRAFAGADPPAHLVLAGMYAAPRFSAFRAAHPELPFPAVTVFDGYVSTEQVHLLHSAADYAVLSFFPNWPNDSGTMCDALSRGLPVCCSDTGNLGRVVREYRVGELFEAGEAASLRAAACRMAGVTIDPGDQAAYLAEFSPQVFARRLISAAVRGSEISTASWS